jgi:hypothetical protein
VLGGALAALVSACGESSPRDETSNASGSSGAGQSGSHADAGSAVAGGGAAQAGSAMGGNTLGGVGGTLPGMTEGGVAGRGGDPGQAGVTDGGAPLGGAGGEGAEGGSAGAGAGEQCDTTPVAQPPGPACAVLPSVQQEYQVGLATEQLSFGVRLRASGYFGPVHLNEIEVHYYFSQEETSGFQPTVDSYILHPAGTELKASSEISIVELAPHQNSTSGPGCQTHFIRIRNTSPLELPPASQGAPYVELYVTLKPNNSAPPNQDHTNDHSYDPEATTWDQTALLGVYHCGNLTSGCTPGDAGTCN